MQTKETTEAAILLGSGINAGYASMSDGTIDFADVGKVFDPLMKGQDGIQGIGDIPTELAAATPEAKEEGKARFAGELESVPAEDAYDITQMYGGFQSTISLVVRKTRKDTANRIAAALNSGPRPASADGARPVTGEDLLALIAFDGGSIDEEV